MDLYKDSVGLLKVRASTVNIVIFFFFFFFRIQIIQVSMNLGSKVIEQSGLGEMYLEVKEEEDTGPSTSQRTTLAVSQDADVSVRLFSHP